MNTTDGLVLLTKRQVAEIVQVSPRTIERMVSSRQFPAPIPLGTGPKPHKRWLRSKVCAWLEKQIKRAEGQE